MSNPGISKIEFAADSPLEELGFEPPVPLAKEAAFVARKGMPESGSGANRGPYFKSRMRLDLAGRAAVHPVVFFGTGTGTPGIFTLTEPRWVRLVK
jgi:hypothetical protein